jgi:hypothetical protein
MGVEARCRPCHSAAHCRHMKRQPCLCHCHPRRGRGRRHCNRCRHLCCWHQLRHNHCCCCPSPLLPAIAVAVAVDHCRHRLCCFAVSRCHCHCHCRHPCHRPLPSPSPSAITVAISIITVTVTVGHFRELLPWCSKNCIQPIEAKNAHLIIFCLDSGRCTDQSRMTDQVSGSNGQHQHWVVSGEQ